MRISKLLISSVILSAFCITCAERKAELVTDSGTTAYVDSTMEYPRLIFADGQVSLNDKCMVRLNKLNRKMPPMYVNGRPVGFCWTPCVRVFVEDPLPNIIKHNLNFQCAVDKSKSANVTESTMRQVNWETFLFSDSIAARKFDSDPVKYCGILTDPITGQRFRPGIDSPSSEYEGRQFYFWTMDSKEKFEMMPAYYSAPNIKMEDINKESDSTAVSH